MKSAVEAEKLDFLYTDDGNVKWYNYSGKYFGGFVKKIFLN